MPLTGHLTYASSFFGENHCGYLFNIGTDADRYVVQHDTGYVAKVGDADSNTQGFTLTEAQFLSDAVTKFPALTGSGRWALTVAAEGTPYFVVLGTYGSLSGHSLQVVQLVYRIDDLSTCPVAYGQLSHTDGINGGDFVPLATVSLPRGAGVIGNRLYYACNLSDNHFSPTSYSCLVDVSLNSDESSAVAGSFGDHSKLLGFSSAYFNTASDGRLLQNRAAVFDAGTGVVGLIVCKDSGDASGPALFGLTVTAGVASATTDLSSAFNFPFADTAKKYDGSASASARDRYTIANVLTDGADWEVLFGRTFSDNRQYVGVRQFSMDSLWPTTATPVANTTYQHTSETVTAGSAESIQFYRDGDDLLGGLRIDSVLYFGSLTLPPPSGGEDTGPLEDEDDFRGPCDVAWPQCGLVPQAIRVEVVTPSVSPGRSLSSREQIVQAEAGFWKIVYENVPVRTKAEALLWREIESAVNGRAGAICVPVYEAPLSSVAVAATSSGDAVAGAVVLGIAQTAGTALRAGQHFTAGERLYRIKAVLGTALGVTSVKVWPPLREPIDDGTVLDFATPSCRCRLATDGEMQLTLELLRFGKKTINFVEDV